MQNHRVGSVRQAPYVKLDRHKEMSCMQALPLCVVAAEATGAGVRTYSSAHLSHARARKNTMRGSNLWEISVQLKSRRVIIHTVWEIKIPFGETVYIILNIVSP